jgi:hypothetical protein
MLCCLSLKCGAQPHNYFSLVFNQFLHGIGIQQGFAFTQPVLRPALDFNAAYGLWNGGFNYQFNYGWNVYAGIGMVTFLEIQYGYALGIEKHLMRIRSDIPAYYWFGDWFEGRGNHPLAYVNLGFYIEHAFDYAPKGTTIGITVSYPIMK